MRAEEKQFVQPVYNQDPISSTLFNSSTFAVIASSTYNSLYNPFYLFNNLYASGGNDTGYGRIWESGSGSKNINPWIKFSNPYPINMTRLRFDFRIEWAFRVPKAVTIYGGDSNSSWTNLTGKVPLVQERTQQYVDINHQNYYKGYYLYFEGSGGTGPYSVTEIANLYITATYEEL